MRSKFNKFGHVGGPNADMTEIIKFATSLAGGKDGSRVTNILT